MNPQIEKFIKLPIYQRLVVVLGVCALLGVAFYFAVFAPKFSEYKNLVKQSSDLQSEINQKKSIADNLGKFRAEYERMQIKLQESLKELPNQKEIPELLTSIASIARQNRLDVKKFLPGAETRRDFYADVPVSLSLVGRYHDVGRFFFDVGEISRIINIGNIKIKTMSIGRDSQPMIQVDCQAMTYRFLPSEDKANSQVPAGGKPK